MAFQIHNFSTAFEAIAQNKTRAILTSLGIIFGVSSVIAMLSVGKGAEQEVLEQLKALGTNNIVVTPKAMKEQAEEKDTDKTSSKERFSPGLTIDDARVIEQTIPNVRSASPEVLVELTAIFGSNKVKVQAAGVDPQYFTSSDFVTESGRFFRKSHLDEAASVCVIGSNVRSRLFPGVNPVGASIKVGSIWLQVIGVLREKFYSENMMKSLGVRNLNDDVFLPYTTVLSRLRNRGLITKASLRRGGFTISLDGGDKDDALREENDQQLDRIVVNVANSNLSMATADVLSRMLKRRHNEVDDFEITVPQLLLRQEQRTKDIFNIVLASIASISLLVGGIGIMNIMLASVLERIKEIGIRRAIGATRSDIILQFLGESMALSLFGGLIGIIVGVSTSLAINHFASIRTELSWSSIALSFGVAASVGLLFGIFPARRASMLDPIQSLRYE